jgi:hypothetical protein
MPISRCGSFQAILDHRQVARFEDVQRQAAAGQQQRPGQGKDRKGLGQVGGRIIGIR